MRESLSKLETKNNKIFENLLKTHDRIKNLAFDRVYKYYKSISFSREYNVIRIFNRYIEISERV